MQQGTKNLHICLLCAKNDIEMKDIATPLIPKNNRGPKHVVCKKCLAQWVSLTNNVDRIQAVEPEHNKPWSYWANGGAD